ncbi:MAG: DUF4397 domain-containing protein [Ignavibacteria bacterium]|nr:DUF4397 domain-containing protein [Ignavibacteria bacterium]MBK7185362.1 DUF4397 domain-containing protein [Ignavibacteria bacterium]MBK7575985.1 DUF4397 domain-containing protein [Ignavibacteria bacterium]
MSARFIALLSVLVLGCIPGAAQLSLITFLNNSPDPQLRTADLYVTQAGTTTKIDDIAFQAADNLNSVAIFGDIEVTFAVAPGSSINAGEAIVDYTFTPGADKGYMAMVNGLKNTAGYVANPNGKNIGLSIMAFEVQASVADPNKTGVYFVHGATDLETGDLYIRGASKATIAGFGYTDKSSTPTVVDRKSTTIDFTKSGDKTKVLASFGVDFSSLASAVVVSVISAFRTPEDNAGSTDTLALLSVLEDGRVVKSPLIAGPQTSRIQIIHNAPDPTLQVVDIYVNGVKTLDNFNFRKASPFQTLPANTPVVIGFAPFSSTAYKDTIKTVTLDPLRPGRSYHLIATGVVDTSKYQHNPDGRPFALTVSVLEGALETSSETGKTAVRVGHYSSDSPQITVKNASVTLGSNLGYGDASPQYALVTPAIDTAWIYDLDNKKVRGYVCDFRGNNKAVLLLASGFAKPDSNQNGPSFKLILVDVGGGVNTNLAEVEPGTVSVDDENGLTSTWTIGPNPSSDFLTVNVPLAPGIAPDDCSAELISASGSIVYKGAMTLNGTMLTASISVSPLSIGTYQLRVISASGTIIGSKGLVVTR